MRIIVADGLVIGWTIHSFKTGERSACFAVKTTYQLHNGVEPVSADEPDPVSGDQPGDGDPTKALLYPTDFAPFKPRADLVVLATAYAPGNRPVSRLPVRIKVGPVDKTLFAYGPRAWFREPSGGHGTTEPQPVVTLPITYQNAFGGATSKRNPTGRGVDTDDLPQIEDPRRLVASPGDAVGPAGFGPWPPAGSRAWT